MSALLSSVLTGPGVLVLQDVLLDMSEATRITEKGQATIPKELREKYDLDPGDGR